MNSHKIASGQYLAPSPAGAYFAVSSNKANPARQLLLNIMQHKSAQLLDLGWLEQLTGEIGQDAIMRLSELQRAHLIQGLDQVFTPPDGPLDDSIPGLLARLALDDGQVLLADDQGFPLVSHGFEKEQAEELSGLSANLATLHERHHQIFEETLDLSSSAWAIVGAGGNSEVGFWPLYIGSQRFVLIIRGIPNLNQPTLVELVWTLTRRYIKQ